MGTPKRNTKHQGFSLFSIIYLDRKSQRNISEILRTAGANEDAIIQDMHLTLYHSRRFIPEFPYINRKVSIEADLDETRLMLLIPGGENPKQGIKPKNRSVGIRLTKRNIAIEEIMNLRRDIYRFEPQFENRMKTTDWRNCFGSRHFQPHIAILRRGNNIEDLSKLGIHLRQNLGKIRFAFQKTIEYK